MDDAGKRNSEALLRAQYLKEHIIPAYEDDVLHGLTALSVIHQYANTLVDHEGVPLSDSLLSKDVLRTYVLALYVELGEFIQTLNWKPWRNADEKPTDVIVDEFADILAFVGVLITILHARGITTTVLRDAYTKKEHVNIARFIKKMEDSYGAGATQ